MEYACLAQLSRVANGGQRTKLTNCCEWALGNDFSLLKADASKRTPLMKRLVTMLGFEPGPSDLKDASQLSTTPLRPTVLYIACMAAELYAV